MNTPLAMLRESVAQARGLVDDVESIATTAETVLDARDRALANVLVLAGWILDGRPVTDADRETLRSMIRTATGERAEQKCLNDRLHTLRAHARRTRGQLQALAGAAALHH